MNYIIEPEVAGQLGENTIMDTGAHPPLIQLLHYSFDGWLGDDLLESFPCYIVTDRLKESIDNYGLSGVKFAHVEVDRSPTFMEIYPGRDLPIFHWLKVIGKPKVDDFGLTDDSRMVVSEAALECLRQFNLNHCKVYPYSEND